MILNIWSVLLIAFASQCVFLIAILAIRPATNKPAARLLILLLFIILCINVSNLLCATYLYRTFPKIAGFARGMVLLLGPVLYLYTSSALEAGFRFRANQLLHLLPYLLSVVIIRLQRSGLPDSLYIVSVDNLMDGRVRMTVRATMWFVLYFVQLTAYLVLIKRCLRHSINDTGKNYLVTIKQRVAWLRRINFSFGLIALVFLAIITYVALTGFYTITGNFVYDIAVSFMVYLISYQAFADGHLILPGFTGKYRSTRTNSETENQLFAEMQRLFAVDKIFTDPDLKIGALAQKLSIHPHVISQIINERLDKTFSDLVNEYRVEEFKIRVTSRQYAHYSIIAIARDVGYKSKSAFNEAFRKYTGLTPSEYLKSASQR